MSKQDKMVKEIYLNEICKKCSYYYIKNGGFSCGRNCFAVMKRIKQQIIYGAMRNEKKNNL